MADYKTVQFSDGKRVYQIIYGSLRECSCGCGPLAVDMAWFKSKEGADGFAGEIHSPETPVACRRRTI